MTNFNQIITNKVVNHLDMIAKQEQEVQSSLLLIQSLFIAENYNKNDCTNSKDRTKFVKSQLIGISGESTKLVVKVGSIAHKDVNENKSKDLKIKNDEVTGIFVFNFFNTGNINRITQPCNNKLLNEGLAKYLENKTATSKNVLEFLKTKNITLSSQLNASCQKQGIFSKSKDKKESKSPSGATNQTDSKNDNDVSIEQELKIESKNNAINLLAEIYPKFYNLNSKDKQLVITLLSNAKNLEQDIKTFNEVLKTESKKIAV
tara:strand:- start:397 stop:1179 length:783 start_codon:yes stop_codon:yes gene_type:complete